MCTDDSACPGSAHAGPGDAAAPAGFASVAEALRAGRAAADYLNSPAARDLDGAACGEALVAIGAIASGLAAAQNGLLRRFDADVRPRRRRVRHHRRLARRPDRPGPQGRQGRRPADAPAGPPPAAGRRGRRRGRHDLVGAGDGRLDRPDRRRGHAAGRRPDPAGSRRRPGRTWTGCGSSPRPPTRPGAPPHPDDDPPGKGFEDRFLQLDTTMDGAGRLTGDLTPECAAAVTAVLQALGKKRGPEDDRTAAQRFHDALQEGCELLIRAKMVPDRAGLRHPRRRPDPPVGPARHGRRLRWSRRPGCGPGPASTATSPARTPRPSPATPSSSRRHRQPRLGRHRPDDHPRHRRPRAPARHGGQPRPARPASRTATGRTRCRRRRRRRCCTAWPGSRSTSSPAPSGIASALRRTLLGAPLNGKSVHLDVGYCDHIPAAIRRAVIARDKHCAWPGGCDRPAAVSDVHHITHKKDGGPTSVNDCMLALPIPPRHLHPPLGMENRTPTRRNPPRHRTPRPDPPKPPAPHHPTRVTRPESQPVHTPTTRPRRESTTPSRAPARSDDGNCRAASVRADRPLPLRPADSAGPAVRHHRRGHPPGRPSARSRRS